MNLEGYEAGPVADADLSIEDRWILSRLSTVTQEVTQSLETYKYSDAARALYDFAWDEFCSFYVEMAKDRLQDPATRTVAQRVLAHTLDTLMRLLHPIMPFITEEMWSLLGSIAPERGLQPIAPTEHVIVAPWPKFDEKFQDTAIEQKFAKFQAVLGALREIRSRQGIAPKQEIEFSVTCEAADTSLLQPMEASFLSMAMAKNVGWGKDVVAPATSATVNLSGMDVHVDLKDFIDVEAEKKRNEKLQQKLSGAIAGKEKKLTNANFVDRAPADVVERERESLAEMKVQLEQVESALEDLRAQQ